MADADTKVTCPKCKHEFVLTEALAAPVVDAARRAFEVERAQLEDDAEKAMKAAVEKAQQKAFERGRAEALSQADEVQSELERARIRLAEQDTKLAKAQAAQAEAARKERELEDARRELDLTVETRISAALGQARAQARREADDAVLLRLQEKDKAMEELRGKIAELERKATHGDNRVQGEVQELELEKRLREAFPRDTVQPVAKGVHGGDAVLRVLNSSGASVGKILFESKETQSFDAKWLPKLREDQRAAGAELAVLVTRTMPKGVELFEQVDGVWVSSLTSAVALTAVLRSALCETYSARKASDGQETKAGLLYAYLTSGGYRHRLTAMVEAVGVLQSGLAKEKAAIERQWALRATTHDRLVAAVVGMHGDVAGIAGQSVQELESASLKALEASGG